MIRKLIGAGAAVGTTSVTIEAGFFCREYLQWGVNADAVEQSECHTYANSHSIMFIDCRCADAGGRGAYPQAFWLDVVEIEGDAG
jgi:hypothetical protein